MEFSYFKGWGYPAAACSRHNHCTPRPAVTTMADSCYAVASTVIGTGILPVSMPVREADRSSPKGGTNGDECGEKVHFGGDCKGVGAAFLSAMGDMDIMGGRLKGEANSREGEIIGIYPSQAPIHGKKRWLVNK